MIPRHSIPFGIRNILPLLISPARGAHSSDVEKAYADALGVQTVVLLPSVRAGIYLMIRAVSGPDVFAAAPAYTCDTVHQALSLSGARAKLVDSAPDSFLMSPEAIGAVAEPGCVLVLSEVYGIPYKLEMIDRTCIQNLRLRIMDLAMCIPSAERMRTLKSGDVALFSFGWGKPMYAGWGAVACFRDSDLGGCVRDICHRWTKTGSFGLGLRQDSSVLMRVLMNQRGVYGLSHEAHCYRIYKRISGRRRPLESTADFMPSPVRPGALPPQWTRPMTALNWKLALANLRHSALHATLRRDQAATYSKLLVEPGVVRGPGSGVLPQSHFPIRIPAVIRDRMCDFLRGRGIDTGAPFPFPQGLKRNDFPNSAKIAEEVVTLPLGPGIAANEVRRVSDCIKEGLRALGGPI